MQGPAPPHGQHLQLWHHQFSGCEPHARNPRSRQCLRRHRRQSEVLPHARHESEPVKGAVYVPRSCVHRRTAAHFQTRPRPSGREASGRGAREVGVGHPSVDDETELSVGLGDEEQTARGGPSGSTSELHHVRLSQALQEVRVHLDVSLQNWIDIALSNAELRTQRLSLPIRSQHVALPMLQPLPVRPRKRVQKRHRSRSRSRPRHRVFGVGPHLRRVVVVPGGAGEQRAKGCLSLAQASRW